MIAGAAPHSILLPVDRMDAAVAFLRDTMGLKLKFQDGTRYAAFEFGNLTLAVVAEGERIVDEPALVFRVGDVAAAVSAVENGGGKVVRPIEQGPHEKRTVLRDASGATVVLSQKTA
jgi:predicted enzyme related to lactoylglutathione lyase